MPRSASSRTIEKAQLTPVIEAYQTQVLRYCDQRMDLFFEATGPALLGFAEIAGSESAQSLFFAAVAQTDEDRPTINKRFQSSLTEGIQHFFTAGRDAPKPWLPVGGIVGSDERQLATVAGIDEALAVKNLIIRTNAHAFPELYALSQRLAVIAGGSKLRDDEIPAGPHHLAHSFRSAIAEALFDIRVKAVLYALFHHYLTWSTAELYHDLNKILREAGILPRTRPVNLRPTRRPTPQLGGNLSHSASTQDHQALHHALVANLLELAAQQRRSALARASRSAGELQPGQSETDHQPESLTTFLTALEHAIGDDLELPLAPGGRAEKIAIAALDKAGSRARESELISNIEHLFAQMLDMPSLPATAKAELARLHTLYLRSALADIGLARDANHPGRRLFDECIEAGCAWIDESDPHWGALPILRDIVERLLESPASEPPPFSQLLDFIAQHVQGLRGPKDRPENRCRDLRRDRLVVREARRHIEAELSALLSAHPVPQQVRTFLDTTWKELLTLVRLHRSEGPDSPSWREAVDTSRCLVELFDPRVSGGALRNRIAELPRLRQRIANGAHRLGSYNRATLATLDALLANPHGVREQLVRSQTLTRRPHRRHAAARSSLDDSSNIETASDQTHRPSESALQAMVEELRKTKSGTWFELDSPLGDEAARRIQLSWISPLTSTYLFVDEAGTKTEMRGLQDLAQAVLSGRARVIAPPELAPAPPVHQTLPVPRPPPEPEGPVPTETAPERPS